MSVEKIIFYVFAAILIASASLVVTTRNSVRATLFLVLCFVCSAILWMLLEAEFLAISLVLVYVGAVMVLFLFVVMMLDVDYAALKSGFVRFLPLALVVAGLVFAAIYSIVSSVHFGLEAYATPAAHPAEYSNIKELGMLIYTDYFYPFELAAVLLLVAIVAAISLTFRGSRERKVQKPEWQVAVNRADRVQLVKMAAVKKEQAAPASDAASE
ncbi:MAG: NADH-quinone oxidoreductase subunit J [Gammaproteobacteria bacterium]|nr:NADH-quinone oxidoreductase subunit J [Gammaproteobacteria bacterium]